MIDVWRAAVACTALSTLAACSADPTSQAHELPPPDVADAAMTYALVSADGQALPSSHALGPNTLEVFADTIRLYDDGRWRRDTHFRVSDADGSGDARHFMRHGMFRQEGNVIRFDCVSVTSDDGMIATPECIRTERLELGDGVLTIDDSVDLFGLTLVLRQRDP